MTLLLLFGAAAFTSSVAMAAGNAHTAPTSTPATRSSSHKKATSKASQSAATNSAVVTYKNDTLRTGQYNETLLNTSNVNALQFGKRVTYPVDGQAYAEPLYMPNLTINGSVHNVVIVATEHDSVYAFDADQTTATAPLWHTTFLVNGASTVSSADVSCDDITPEYGITSTPVIDPSTGTLYVIVNTKENGQILYRLHALDISTGLDKQAPTVIQASVPGNGAGSVNGTVNFQAKFQLNRSGLLLLNGVLYTGWGSHCDNFPYHGWVLGYNASNFQQTSVYNTSPDGTQNGVWGAGEGLATDGNGNLFFATGNGTFNLNSGGNSSGDSVVRWNIQTGKVADYFTPFNQQCLDVADRDLASSGTLLLPTSSELIVVGKEGRIYVVNRDNMGKYTPIANPCSNQGLTNVDKIVQELPPNTAAGGVWGSPTYWKAPDGTEYVYIVGSQDHAKAWKLNNGLLVTPPASQSPEGFTWPGGDVVISSDGTTSGSGIAWLIDPDGVLRAYNATNLGDEIYNSGQVSGRDGLGSASKFSIPTITDGKVFVGTHNSLAIFGELFSGSGYNNVGITDDVNTIPGNMDGDGFSYSAQTLQAAGIAPGQAVNFNGVTFTWPNVPSGTADNYLAQGQTIAVTPVNGATTLAFLGASSNGNSGGTATINYADGTTQTFTLNFTDWWAGGPAPGDGVVASLAYHNTQTGKAAPGVKLFYTEVHLQGTATVQSVTLPSSVTVGQLHVFAIGTRAGISSASYNNIGIADDSNPGPGNFDLGGCSYSAQALQGANFTPGGSVSFNNIQFTWPNVPSGTADNYQAQGQTIAVTPVNGATALAFLGSATNGPASGTADIAYTDGTIQTFSLGFSDWTLGAGKSGISFGNGIAATTAYRDCHTGTNTVKTYVFYAETPLQPGKTVESVVLPPVANQGHLHVFAIGTRAIGPPPGYNNVGISNDSSPKQGNLDGGGFSYSAQTLQAAGIVPGNIVTFNGVAFSWPLPAAGQPDNYQAQGQTLPVTPVNGATTLAFLGTGASGSASGTATINYADGTTQTFTLGFTDWAVSPPAFGNAVVVTLPYRNRTNGKQSLAVNLFYAQVSLQSGKALQSVTLPLSVSGGQLHVFVVGTKAGSGFGSYNNVGVTDDSTPSAGNFDGGACSYSAQTLQSAGITQGQPVSFNGVSFTWPNVAPGVADNYQAQGQPIAVTPVNGATTIAFLGSATNGPASGTVTIVYTDGTIQAFSLGFSDWTLGANKTGPSFGNRTVATLPYRNCASRNTIQTYLFYTDVALLSGKTVQYVILPYAANQGHLHVFAIGTK